MKKQILIQKIKFKDHQLIEKDAYKRISLAIQKIGSSNKTKILHKLSAENMLYIGAGSTNLTKIGGVTRGVYYLNDAKFSGVTADIKYTVSSADRAALSSNIEKLLKISKEKERIKTTITDTSDLQLNILNKENTQVLEDIVDDINYFDLNDIYYSLFIEALISLAMKDKGKIKLFEEGHKLFSVMIKRNLSTYFKDSPENNSKLDVLIDYIYASLFTSASKGSILSNIKRMYPEEKTSFLTDIKPGEITHLKDSAELLTSAGIMNITPNALENKVKSTYSNDLVEAIDTGFEEFISLTVSSLYKSTIFDTKMIDETIQKRIEDLVLNYKSKIIYKK